MFFWQNIRIQGADNKLGQFLSQDMYATANHRNCLRHSLESCPSLVWCNVNRPSLAKKKCRQSNRFFEGVLKALRAHTAKIIQPGWSQPEKNHCSKEIWPPSSPDCNPFDSSMWCEFERKVNKQPHNTLASLRAKILEVMANMDREFVICWSRIEAAVDASGDFIK